MPDIFDAKKDTSSAKKTHSTPVEDMMADEYVVEAEDVETAEAELPKPTRNVDDYSSIMRNYRPGRNPLAAFAAKPTNFAFDTQQDEEKVLLLLRQHPVTQVKWVIVALVLIFLPFLFSAIGFLDFLPARFHVVALLGWYLMIVGFSLEAFLSWFYNVYIITDERVIDVDFPSLLFKNISYAKIDNIEDLTATTTGTLGAIFDYGTVKIQTAAATTEFEFEDVPRPNQVAAFINELLVEEEREKIERRVR